MRESELDLTGTSRATAQEADWTDDSVSLEAGEEQWEGIHALFVLVHVHVYIYMYMYMNIHAHVTWFNSLL